MSTINVALRAEPFDSAARGERNAVKSNHERLRSGHAARAKSKRERKPKGLLLLTPVLAIALGAPAAAEKKSADPVKDYPNKPIRWIIDFGSGGLSDTLARIVGLKLTEAWHEPVINQT